MTEKEQMLTSILNCRRADLYTGDVVLNEGQEKIFATMQARRAKGEPLQYILRETGFLNLSLRVEDGIFIPRSETEVLVDRVLREIRSRKLDQKESLRILDIGTGTGNIAAALAFELDSAAVTAVDVSPRALLNAYKNAGRYNLYKRITLIQSDLFRNLPSDIQYDVIVTNPPYIARGDMPHLPEDVRQEPTKALNGGIDGMDFYRRMMSEIRYYLVPGGIFACEMGAGQKSEIFRTLKNSQAFETIKFYKDLAGLDRVAIAALKTERQDELLSEAVSLELRG